MARLQSSSQSRKNRVQSILNARTSNWRPRVSSPLATEVVFSDLDEKMRPSEERPRIMVTSLDKEAGEEYYPVGEPEQSRRGTRSRMAWIQIGLCLLVDCVLSLWLSRIGLENMIRLRSVMAGNGSERTARLFDAPGPVVVCSDPAHRGMWMLDRLERFNASAGFSAGQEAELEMGLPANCSLLPRLMLSLGHSQVFLRMLPISVASLITLKLCMGFLFLRTSSNLARSLAIYLKASVGLHLLISYLGFLLSYNSRFLKLDLFSTSAPEQLMRTMIKKEYFLQRLFKISSECLFFLIGVTLCLGLLLMIVLPLLWISSRHSGYQSNQHFSIDDQESMILKTSQGFIQINPQYPHSHSALKVHPHRLPNFYHLSAISQHKKKSLLSRF